MSVTSGFFNSLNHDRRYNAQQMSSIFDGVINDGVFANIGVAFKVTAAGGVTVNIGEGKAWFNSAWVYNDTILPLTLEASEVVLDRIDAIVIDVDHNESVRSGTIKIVKGTPSSNPKRPTLASDAKHKQAPLAYITRKAGSTEITQANITSMIGTSECPYITGILQVQNIDSIVAQWNAQWTEWYAAKVAKTNSDVAQLNAQLNEWYASTVAETDSDVSEILAEMQAEFDSWFDDFKSVLDDDVASSLAAKVADLMAKFDTLAKEGAVYDEIEDSDLDEILGSDGTPIQGKTVIGSGTGGSVDLSEPMSGNLDMNNYRVMNVADPEQDSDAVNAGYVKMVAGEVATAASKASTPRNLLDNSDFRNPVNQRGQTRYTANGYGVDRWSSITGPTTVEVYDGYVRVVAPTGNTARFRQTFKNGVVKLGEAYTFAFKMVNEPVRISHGVFNDNNSLLQDLSSTLGFYYSLYIENGANIFIQFGIQAGKSIELEWAALYEGEYTLDTLPEYQPKGYEQELLICRQYDPTTGEYIGLRKFSQPRNLLDNSDFTNPVNQRKTTSLKPGTTKTYFIDRWCSARSDVSVSNNGLLLKWDGTNGTDGYIQQIVEGNWAQGNIITVSAKVDGEVCSAVLTLGASGATVTSFVNENLYFSVAWTTGKLFVTLTTKKVAGVTIKWMSLYEGEYTIDTLPEYQPKGYSAELLECTRYFVRFGNRSQNNHIGYAQAATSTVANAVLAIPVPMRINNPTVTVSGKAVLRHGATDIEISTLSVNSSMSGPFIYLAANSTGLTSGDFYPLRLVLGTLDFSADL